MKLAKALLVALAFSGTSAFAATNATAPVNTSNSTCTHSNKSDSVGRNTGNQYASVVFGGAKPQSSTYQQTTPSTSR